MELLLNNNYSRLIPLTEPGFKQGRSARMWDVGLDGVIKVWGAGVSHIPVSHPYPRVTFLDSRRSQ